MKCATHLLGRDWEHHDWHRRVTATETISSTVTTMWGGQAGERHVVCHTQEVCTACGAVRDTGACLCDTAKGDVCAVRLACLEGSR